jgi:hypothetical protein
VVVVIDNVVIVVSVIVVNDDVDVHDDADDDVPDDVDDDVPDDDDDDDDDTAQSKLPYLQLSDVLLPDAVCRQKLIKPLYNVSGTVEAVRR